MFRLLPYSMGEAAPKVAKLGRLPLWRDRQPAIEVLNMSRRGRSSSLTTCGSFSNVWSDTGRRSCAEGVHSRSEICVAAECKLSAPSGIAQGLTLASVNVTSTRSAPSVLEARVRMRANEVTVP